MEHPTNQGTVLRWIALAAALAGCSAEPDAAVVAGDEPVSEDDEVIVCGDPSLPENVFVRPAIAAKFAHYPEFAEYAGLQSVASCDDARAFSRAYVDYSALHPGFDDDQPLGAVSEALAEPSDAPEPYLELPKILNDSTTPVGAFPNWTFPFSPIVGLQNQELSRCTGTFIAKNFILTAAHCLAVIKASASAPKRFRGYGTFTIDWPNRDGERHDDVRLFAFGLQLPHPNYTGGGNLVDDMALIYLPPQVNDRLLPGDASAGAAMRISRFPPWISSDGQPEPNHPTFIAGFGLPTSTLRVSVVSVATNEVNRLLIPVTSASQTRSCKGDSGGPLFETNTIGGISNVPMLLGSLSGATPSAGGPDCAVVGQTQLWQRLDVLAPRQNTHFKFITEQMRKWYGKNFECTAGKSDGISDPTFVECWGKPCQQDSQCGKDFYCSRPREDYIDDFCPYCEGCGCIVGQCLPESSF